MQVKEIRTEFGTMLLAAPRMDNPVSGGRLRIGALRLASRARSVDCATVQRLVPITDFYRWVFLIPGSLGLFFQRWRRRPPPSAAPEIDEVGKSISMAATRG